MLFRSPCPGATGAGLGPNQSYLPWKCLAGGPDRLALDGPRIDLSSEVRPHLVICLRVVQIIQVKSSAGQPLPRLSKAQIAFLSVQRTIIKDDHRARFVCSIQSTLRALVISASQQPALFFIETQKLFGCLGLAGVNQFKLGPLRSSSAVNTRFV